ncbi:single-stranded DNA-binding protein [Terrabacter terrigena]|uniref:Single-stranded DNA-binding protein n=1 Tax=Terrabacter terrigena TaxID=574718 RepID=A0ABW3MZZ1_9MICO
MRTSRTPTDTAGRTAAETPTDPPPGRNEVVLGGRVAARAEERELPSGDRIVTLRVVVPRSDPPRRRKDTGETPRRATVDTIDVVCWSAATRRTAMRLREGDLAEVEGSLRRRFFGGVGGRQSRYEVEASLLRRVSGGRSTGT